MTCAVVVLFFENSRFLCCCGGSSTFGNSGKAAAHCSWNMPVVEQIHLLRSLGIDKPDSFLKVRFAATASTNV
jgi:hypothetical protein